ncbi:hypothetical protein [Streptomyces sp. NPDC001781]
MRARPETGYRIAQPEDDRTTTPAAPSISPALRRTTDATLDDNTPKALSHFPEVDRHQIA